MTADEFRQAALDAGGDPGEIERIIREQREDEARGIVLLTFEEILPTFGEA